MESDRHDCKCIQCHGKRITLGDTLLAHDQILMAMQHLLPPMLICVDCELTPCHSGIPHIPQHCSPVHFVKSISDIIKEDPQFSYSP
eukprot:14869217-Ditylum_brightwellii.AAC.1